MRIGDVIGTVTLARSHPSLSGASYRLVQPLSLVELQTGGSPKAETIVVYDELGAGFGQRIAIAESTEAAMPFYPEDKPVDGYIAALIDQLQIVTETTN